MFQLFYDIGYRHFRMPWEIGPREELVALVQEGRLRSGRAVDLGCGTGANSVYLAEHGWEVVGVDFAASAIDKARRKATEAGVDALFQVDDLTALALKGKFDLLVDYGTLDDLSDSDRDAYVRNVVPLCRPGGHFLLWCFEWEPRWFERLTFGPMAPGEVERRFEPFFEVEVYRRWESGRRLMPSGAAYLMTRKESVSGTQTGEGTPKGAQG